jgi:SAM-dependent methyltransferase
VGSGLGQLTRAMARAVGKDGQVIGIERSAEQLAEARRLAQAEEDGALAEMRQGDALALPLSVTEWGTFDVAHTRFLLEHVPHPLAVVKSMVRAVRPGGRIVLQDDDHGAFRMWPEPSGAVQLWGAYIATYGKAGNDAFVGRRLVELLHTAGAEPVRNTWLFFGSCSGHPDFPRFASNLIEILVGAKEAILETGHIDSPGYEAAMTALRAWSQGPDSALWYAVSWAEGRRPKEST